MQSFGHDLRIGLSRTNLWLALASDEFRSRYHRTLMGPIWITATFLVFISVKIFIFSEMARTDLNYYIAHLVLGFAIWNYFTSEINNGATAFLTSRNWILGIKVPYSLFIFQSTASSLINFFFSMIAALLLTQIYYGLTLYGLFHASIGLAFVMFSFFWVKFAIAILCVFFRDLVHLISTTMRVGFFLTPIIWVESTLGPKSKFLMYNPFYHYMNLLRSPMRDGEIVLFSWYVVGGLTVIAILTTVILYQFMARKIPSHI